LVLHCDLNTREALLLQNLSTTVAKVLQSRPLDKHHHNLNNIELNEKARKAYDILRFMGRTKNGPGTRIRESWRARLIRGSLMRDATLAQRILLTAAPP
jgi:hypothetical protein